MALDRRKKEEVYKFDLNLQILDLMLAYCYSSNESVTMKGLVSLKNLIDKVDFQRYSDYELSFRLELLKYSLEAIVVEGLSEIELTRQHVYTNMNGDIDNISILFDNIMSAGELSDSDIEYINRFVADRLTNIHIYKEADELESCLMDLQSGAKSIAAINAKFEKVVTTLFKGMRSAKAASENSSNMDFSLNDPMSLSFAVDRTIKELNKPSNFMSTGLKEFNNLLGGGFQAGRCYLLLGLPKGFKSGTLLNVAIWSAKYNKNVLTKDPTKKPCIVYITMENSIKETLERMYTYASGGTIKNVTREDAMNEITRELRIEGSEVDLVIWYRPNKSINTMDLDSMVDDLAAEGKECVMLIQDYAKRIRPAEYTGDMRIDLGNVIDDFTVIAKQRGIPVVTASQLNREAMKIFEDHAQKGKNDVAKQLGSSNVGESALMIENTDYAIIVNREKSEAQNKHYLTFKTIASRSNTSDVSYFVHPFEEGNPMKLIEDVRLAKSHSFTSISDALGGLNPNELRDGGAPAVTPPSRFNNGTLSNDFNRVAATATGEEIDF